MIFFFHGICLFPGGYIIIIQLKEGWSKWSTPRWTWNCGFKASSLLMILVFVFGWIVACFLLGTDLLFVKGCDSKLTLKMDNCNTAHGHIGGLVGTLILGFSQGWVFTDQGLVRRFRVIGGQVALVTDCRNQWYYHRNTDHPGLLGCWNHAVKSLLIGKKHGKSLLFWTLYCKKTAPKFSGQVISATSQHNLGTICRCLIYVQVCYQLGALKFLTRLESDLNLTTIRFFCGFFFSTIFCVRWHLYTLSKKDPNEKAWHIHEQRGKCGCKMALILGQCCPTVAPKSGYFSKVILSQLLFQQLDDLEIYKRKPRLVDVSYPASFTLEKWRSCQGQSNLCTYPLYLGGNLGLLFGVYFKMMSKDWCVNLERYSRKALRAQTSSRAFLRIHFRFRLTALPMCWISYLKQ